MDLRQRDLPDRVAPSPGQAGEDKPQQDRQPAHIQPAQLFRARLGFQFRRGQSLVPGPSPNTDNIPYSCCTQNRKGEGLPHPMHEPGEKIGRTGVRIHRENEVSGNSPKSPLAPKASVTEWHICSNPTNDRSSSISCPPYLQSRPPSGEC